MSAGSSNKAIKQEDMGSSSKMLAVKQEDTGGSSSIKVAVKQEDDMGDISSSNAPSVKQASSSWRLGEDACVRFKDQQAEAMVHAGRWMLENAAKARESNSIEFVLDSGKTILGQKLWLMARCEYIRQMMSSGMEESRTGVVRVRECGEGAFVGLLEYIYTGKLVDACLGQDWE